MEKPLWMKVKDTPGAAAKKAMYQEAMLSGNWIYSKISKKWYTPEEFIESSETIPNFRNNVDISNFAVKNPLIGLQERIDLLKRTQKEIDDFNQKLHSYYELRKR